MSCRAGMEQNARVSSMNPDVREKPAVSVTARRNRRIASGRVEEPPRRADVDRRVEAGQRRELAGEHGLVEREQHQVEVRVGAVALEQRAQRVGELRPRAGCRRRCRARSASAVGPWWLRRTPGCSVITRPSSQDIRAISSSMCRRSATQSAGVAVAGQRRPVDARRLGGGRAARCATSSWLWSADVAPCADEVRAGAPPSRPPSRRSRRCRCRLTSPSRVDGGRPAGARRPRGSGRGGTSGSRGRTRRRVGGERRVRGQVVARVVGGGEHLDAEPLEQRPGPVGVGSAEPRRRAGRRSRRRSRPTAPR